MSASSESAEPIITLNHADVADLINEQLSGFVRYARENRFRVGIAETLDCQKLIERIGIVDKKNLKMAMRGLLCSNPDDWVRYDRLFDLFWLQERGRGSSRASTGGVSERDKSMPAAFGEQESSVAGGHFDVPDAGGVSDNETSDGRLSQDGASRAETKEQTNFKQLNSAVELREMEELAEQLARKIRRQVLRSLKISQRGRQIDMRRTLRSCLQHGGEPLKLHKRKRKVHIPKLVLLLDVSRSMSVYSYLFLRFARGILATFKDSDAFAFHTKLQHIGEVLREKNRVSLIEKMELISFGWGGGTRLDTSLEEFNRRYARNVLNRRTIFVVVSDGYDTGEPDSLARQLGRIKAQVRRVVWVNPLLGQESYTPSTRSMQAALPLVDVFAAGHNLESLAALELPLAQL